ncbi:hypothetical protein D3C84_1112590 [compost metagenome]
MVEIIGIFYKRIPITRYSFDFLGQLSGYRRKDNVLIAIHDQEAAFRLCLVKSFEYLRTLHEHDKSKIRIISALNHDGHEAADGFMFKGGDGVEDGGRVDFKTL